MTSCTHSMQSRLGSVPVHSVRIFNRSDASTLPQSWNRMRIVAAILHNAASAEGKATTNTVPSSPGHGDVTTGHKNARRNLTHTTIPNSKWFADLLLFVWPPLLPRSVRPMKTWWLLYGCFVYVKLQTSVLTISVLSRVVSLTSATVPQSRFASACCSGGIAIALEGSCLVFFCLFHFDFGLLD